MVHTGWLTSSDVNFASPSGAVVGPMRMNGMPFGIGGAAKVHLWNWLRVGSEGFVSHLNYGKNNSNESIGWEAFWWISYTLQDAGFLLPE